MPTPAGRVTIACFCSLLAVNPAHAQQRGSGWSTSGADAQRSSWVRSDAKISLEGLRKPGFQFLWKLKLNTQPAQWNSLTSAVTLEGYIGYRGFRTLAHLGGSSNKVFAVDTDLGRLEWEKQLPFTAGAANASTACPGGMTSEVTRATAAAIPAAPGARGGGGLRGGARSGVGEPGEGAVTIATTTAAAAPAAARAPGAARAGRGAPARTLPNAVYAIASDGKLHSLLVSNGEPAEAPMDFLPANANAHGLIVVDNTAYAASAEGCAGSTGGLYALDLFEKKSASWKPGAGAIAGSHGPAFGPDGSLYVATTGGDLVHLEAKTLEPKETYSAGSPGFATSPVVFDYQGKVLAAAAAKDGSIHLVDGARRLSKSDPPAKAGDASPAALASWQDTDGTRWILAPTPGGIAAWRVVDRNGAATLESAWVSQEMAAPVAPMVINGVVFALSSGGVLYGLDSSNGRELWNSGKTIGSLVRGGALSGSGSQIYLETYDGTLYAFGFPLEH